MTMAKRADQPSPFYIHKRRAQSDADAEAARRVRRALATVGILVTLWALFMLLAKWLPAVAR